MTVPRARRSPQSSPNKGGRNGSADDFITRCSNAPALFVVVILLMGYVLLSSLPVIFNSGGREGSASASSLRMAQILNDTRTQSAELKAALERRLEDFVEHEHDQYKSDLDAVRGSLEGYKDEVDALRIANAELRNRTHALSARLNETQDDAYENEERLKAKQAAFGSELASISARVNATAMLHRRARIPAPSKPAVPNGLIVIDVREKSWDQITDELLLAWLMNARRTTHNMPVEFWTGHTTKLGSWLSGFLEANAEWITLRRFPEQGKFPKSMRMPDSLSLNDERGAHIGKAYALAESAFSFPVFMDTDVFMCQGWWEKLMQLTADHPETDVFWTNDGWTTSLGGNNDTDEVIADAYVSREAIDPHKDEYAKFTDRNGGTFVAVRQTPPSRAFLIDALQIFVEQHKQYAHMLVMFATDQAALREAMFVNRNKVKEKVIPLWREEHEDTGEGGKYNWACKSGPYNQEWEGQKCMCKSQCLLTHGKYGRCWSSEGFAHNGMPYWLGYEYNDFHRTNGGPYHRG